MVSIRVQTLRTVQAQQQLEVDVLPHETVGDLKAKIAKAEGRALGKEALLVNGRFLKDEEPASPLATTAADAVFLVPTDSLAMGGEKYDSAQEEVLRRKAGLAANWEGRGQMYEYTSAANPAITPQPYLVLPSRLHREGPTRIIPFDLSQGLKAPFPATSPNLLASYVRIAKAGERIESTATATSQAFYVISGSGASTTEYGVVEWGAGDLFTVPAHSSPIAHEAKTDNCALYWISDQPLLNYLGVVPSQARFEPTLYRREAMMQTIERIRHEPGAEHRNRVGFLFGTDATRDNTLTLTHTLWALLNLLPSGDNQRPHRHNSVALDFAVKCAPGCYTLMGWELDEHGWVKDPIRADWEEGACFVTPPGMWHSHHNESGQDALVLPIQDAGLVTYQRVLHITFSLPEQYPASPKKPTDLGGPGALGVYTEKEEQTKQ